MPPRKLWESAHAVVGGATSGLGWHVAHQLARQGAHLWILGRDATRLDDTQDRLLAAGAAQVHAHSLDLARLDAAQVLQQQCPDAFRDRQDLVINAVGRSDRGWIKDLEPQALISLFQTNVISSLNLAHGCGSALVAARGVMVHVGSLSSKVAPPGLGGYSITKFSLAALNQQLRLEWEPQGVHSLLVCPGPIRREDSGARYDALVQQKDLPSSLAKPGGGARLKALDPEWLAERLLLAAKRREAELIVPGKVRWLVALTALVPAWGDWILKRSIRNS